ncbi:MAG: S-layer homology domain-containing protein [Evtepia gabavorous]
MFLYRYGEYSGRDVEKRDNLQGYADRSQVAPWAEEAVQWAVAEGILRGTGRETLAPQATADRAQMAVMVQRFWRNERTPCDHRSQGVVFWKGMITSSRYML